MNAELAKTTIICLTVVVFAGVVGASFVVNKMLSVSAGKKPVAFIAVFNEGNALRLLTVLLVLTSATYLALADRLSEGIISLLSGVAGFVLGGIRLSTSSQRSTLTARQPTEVDQPSHLKHEEP